MTTKILKAISEEPKTYFVNAPIEIPNTDSEYGFDLVDDVKECVEIKDYKKLSQALRVAVKQIKLSHEIRLHNSEEPDDLLTIEQMALTAIEKILTAEGE